MKSKTDLRSQQDTTREGSLKQTKRWEGELNYYEINDGEYDGLKNEPNIKSIIYQ